MAYWGTDARPPAAGGTADVDMAPSWAPRILPRRRRARRAVRTVLLGSSLLAAAAAQHLPGEAAWVVGERRASGEAKYYLSNLPAEADLKTLAAAIKARWACEQAPRRAAPCRGVQHARRSQGRVGFLYTRRSYEKDNDRFAKA